VEYPEIKGMIKYAALRVASMNLPKKEVHQQTSVVSVDNELHAPPEILQEDHRPPFQKMYESLRRGSVDHNFGLVLKVLPS